MSWTTVLRDWCTSTTNMVILSILLLLSACVAPGPATTTPTVGTTVAAAEPTVATEGLFPLTITDAADQQFTFDAPPQIGCSWYGCYETLSDLGIAPHASAGGGNPADRGRSFYTPGPAPTHLIADGWNPELWAAAAVDLIVEGGPPSPQVDALATAAPVFYLHTTWDDVPPPGYQAYGENLRLFGQLTSQPAAAEAAIARFETVLDKLRSLATPETQALTVAVLHAGEGYSAAGPISPFCSVIAEVGLGTCVGAGDFTEINAEEFLALDPDWILYMVWGDESYQDRTDPVWPQLSAVQNGQVYDTQSNRHFCCSLRGLIHPLQEYVHHILPAANIPDPGSTADFDPAQSPLVQTP